MPTMHTAAAHLPTCTMTPLEGRRLLSGTPAAEAELSEAAEAALEQHEVFTDLQVLPDAQGNVSDPGDPLGEWRAAFERLKAEFGTSADLTDFTHLANRIGSRPPLAGNGPAAEPTADVADDDDRDDTRIDVAGDPASSSDFTVYDAMRVDPDGADRDAPNMVDIYVSYGELYHVDADGNVDNERPWEQRIRRIARDMQASGQKWVLDIEHWPTDVRSEGEQAVRRTMDRLIEILDWIEDEAPDVEVGFYGIMPIRDYWTNRNLQKAQHRYDTAVANGQGAGHLLEMLQRAQAKHDQWQAANDFLRPLADRVDFIAPSLYTFYDKPEAWQFYAERNLEQAGRYGKPVLPFLHSQLHTSVDQTHTIDNDFWRLQLETVRDSDVEQVEGLVLWRGFGELPADTPWWQETLDFLSTLDDGTDAGDADKGDDDDGEVHVTHA